MKKIVILLLLSCFTCESHCIVILHKKFRQEEDRARHECGRIDDDELNRRINTPTTMTVPSNAPEIIRNIYLEERKRRDLRKETERLNNLENSANQMPLDELFQQIQNTKASRDLEILNEIYLKRKKQQDDVLIRQIPSLLSKIEEMSKEIKSLKEQNTELQQYQNDLVNWLYYY